MWNCFGIEASGIVPPPHSPPSSSKGNEFNSLTLEIEFYSISTEFADNTNEIDRRNYAIGPVHKIHAIFTACSTFIAHATVH